MSNQAIITAAINGKHSVSFIYNNMHREVSPHEIGYKNGKINFLGYQFGGESSEGNMPKNGGNSDAWRCFVLEKVRDLKPIQGWYTASNHSTKQTCVDVSIARAI